MRDARQISARDVSQGVQRPALCLDDVGGRRVVARGGATPPVFRAGAAQAVGTGSTMPSAADRWASSISSTVATESRGSTGIAVPSRSAAATCA